MQIKSIDSMLPPDDQLIENSNTTLMEKEFTEQADWSPMVVLIAVLLGILITLTTAGNLMVCRLVWVCRRMQIPSLYFVASMSFSDFLMGLLVMPISLAYHLNYQTTGRWIFGHFMCNLWLFLNFVLCSASIYNLCVVSGDRYLAVTSPLKYLPRMNDRRVKQIIGVSWFCAFALAAFVTYGTNTSKENSQNCSVWGLRYEYSVVVLIVGYILPVFFLIFVNGKVLVIAHSHMNRIHAQEMASVSAFTIDRPSQGTTSRTVQRTRLRREIKIFKTFVVVTCTFLLSWTPFVAILLVDSIWTVPELVRHSSIILLYCNSALNPFIYGFYNAEFRKLLKESIRCKCATSMRKISPS